MRYIVPNSELDSVVNCPVCDVLTKNRWLCNKCFLEWSYADKTVPEAKMEEELKQLVLTKTRKLKLACL